MKLKLMIVDDDSDLRTLISQSLKAIDLEYEITEAESGEDCLKKIRENKPQVILMDLMMPGIDGMDTTIRIKQDPSFKDIKIIYLTAKTDKLSKGMGAISGEAYIEKPVDTQVLDKKIKEVFMGKSNSQQ
ncbi:MAG: PleD family two-component system response regulator [Candidatus Woesearchaeota archaeon]